MLERRHRLTSSAGFTSATRSGRRAGSRTLVVHLAQPSAASSPSAPSSPSSPSSPTGSSHGPRVGFVVSKAVGDAVTRNRVRRRLRHLVRARLETLPAGVLVVRALPGAATATSATLGRDLDTALARVLRGAPSSEGAAR